MKKIILILIVLSAFIEASAQPGYTLINQRYNWLAGLFSALGVPSGGNAAFTPGQSHRSGALYYDSTGADSGLYVYTGLIWLNLSQGGVTTLYTGDGALTGNRAVDLNGMTLSFNQGLNAFIFVDPTTGGETARFQAIDALGSQAKGEFSTTTTNSIAKLSAVFQSTNEAYIHAFADVGTDSIAYVSNIHHFVGPLRLVDLSGNGSGFVAVDNSGNLTWTGSAGTPNLSTVTAAGNETTTSLRVVKTLGGFDYAILAPDAPNDQGLVRLTDAALSETTDYRMDSIVYRDSTLKFQHISGTLALLSDITNAGFVPTSRTISTTSPLAGGGDLSANRTLSIANAAADGSTKGAASFGANDFDAASGNITIDYTNGPAARSLNNLAAVAIATPLLPSGDNTVDFGSSTFGWKDTYSRTVKMKGSTSGTVTINSDALSNTLQATVLSGAGAVPVSYSVFVRSDETLANSAADQNLFANTAHDVIAVLANTTYFFEGSFDLTHGATAHSLALGFTPTTATVTNIAYNTYHWATAVGTQTASQTTNRVKVTTTVALNASLANATETVDFRGWITIGNTGGTITPQIKFSVDPTGTILLKTGAYMRVFAVGNDTITENGPWQ